MEVEKRFGKRLRPNSSVPFLWLRFHEDPEPITCINVSLWHSRDMKIRNEPPSSKQHESRNDGIIDQWQQNNEGVYQIYACKKMLSKIKTRQKVYEILKFMCHFSSFLYFSFRAKRVLPLRYVQRFLSPWQRYNDAECTLWTNANRTLFEDKLLHWLPSRCATTYGQNMLWEEILCDQNCGFWAAEVPPL